jgi:hypothetical protein
MNYVSDIVRSEGDPKVLRSGPSSLGASDSLARGLGWFSLALGATELFAAERLASALGMQGKQSLIRAYGIREIGSGILSLSVDKQAGLWSRVAGDGLDIATLMTAFRPNNPKRENVGIALAMVLGVTLLDLVGAQGLSVRHSRRRGELRDYRDRSGFPRGVGAARGLAGEDFETPVDMRGPPSLSGLIDREPQHVARPH